MYLYQGSRDHQTRRFANTGSSSRRWIQGHVLAKLGLGPLVALEVNQNSTTYKKLLKDVLLTELQAAGRPMTFMHDNTRCHTAITVREFLAENNVSVLPWPAQSLDLNPIESLWSIIKKRRSKKFGSQLRKKSLLNKFLTFGMM